ncbi:hypothetical protein AADZ91_16900 [Colwelliaceae bacterium 6441]
MTGSRIELWLMISREYNENPILKTFLPAQWISARRIKQCSFFENLAKRDKDYAGRRSLL